MSRDPECVTCGQRLRNGACATCLDEWAAYKAEMDVDFWSGGDDQ